MRWFLAVSVVLHGLILVGLAVVRRPGHGASPSPFAESLPAPEVAPFAKTKSDRIDFEIVDVPMRPVDQSARPLGTRTAAKPKTDPPKPGRAVGYRLKQVDGYQITIGPSFTGADRGGNSPTVDQAPPAELKPTANTQPEE